METLSRGLFILTCPILIAALILTSCSDHQTDAIDNETVLQSDDSDFVLDDLAPSEDQLQELFNASSPKRKTAGGIVHYEFLVRLGPGPYDVVRIHRLVQERRPFRPIRTRGSVFMTHGASNTFEAIFLNSGSENPTPETSIVLYMANNNIDVWGLDFAWTLVPEETTDFAFMQDWGVDKDVKHTLAAMSVARFFRGLTGQGFGRMNLLGFSYGAAIAYAAAGHETEQHRIFRDIRGIIPVDFAMKYPDPENSPSAPCTEVENSGGMLEMGVYENNLGIVAKTVSTLATTAPDEPSPLPPFAGLTNYQAALAIGLFPSEGRAFWHFVAGIIESGLPTGLQYSDPSRWIGLLGALPPYMPVRARYEIGLAGCENEDVTFDDNLGNITLPILYLGAGGAYGAEGEYTATLTASRDISAHIVSVSDNPLFDYGHADLFLGYDAADLAWDELARWIIEQDKKGWGHSFKLTKK